MFKIFYFLLGYYTSSLPVMFILSASDLSVTKISMLQILIFLPWYVKPLIGMACDTLKLYGRHMQITIYALLSIAALATFAARFTEDYTSFAMTMEVAMWSIVWTDVCFDGTLSMVAKREESTGKAQTTAFAYRVGGSLVSSLMQLFVLRKNGGGAYQLSPKRYLVLTGFTLTVLTVLWSVFWNKRQGVNQIAIMERISAKETIRRVWRHLKSKMPLLAVVVFSNAIPSVGDGLSLYLLKSEEKGGLDMDADKLSILSMISSLTIIITANACRKMIMKVSPRTIFATCLLMRAFLSAMLILLVKHYIKMSPFLFLALDDIFETITGEVFTLLCLILAVKDVDDSIHTTSYAAFMSISNVSNQIGSLLGSLVCDLTHVLDSKFETLWMSVLVNVACTLGVAVLVLFIPGLRKA